MDEVPRPGWGYSGLTELVDIDGESSVVVVVVPPCPRISKDEELGDEEREGCKKSSKPYGRRSCTELPWAWGSGKSKLAPVLDMG